MIGVDTNVLLRIVLEDDPVQSPAAQQRLEESASNGELIFVSSVVLAETVWVLKRLLKADRNTLARTLGSIVTNESIQLENAAVIEQALADYRNTDCDFADALIGRTAERAGCSTTLTFDVRAATLTTLTTVAP